MTIVKSVMSWLTRCSWRGSASLRDQSGPRHRRKCPPCAHSQQLDRPGSRNATVMGSGGAKEMGCNLGHNFARGGAKEMRRRPLDRIISLHLILNYLASFLVKATVILLKVKVRSDDVFLFVCDHHSWTLRREISK